MEDVGARPAVQPTATTRLRALPAELRAALGSEIADCEDTIQLTFDVDAGVRENSLHKLDTLLAALGAFRAALILEFEPYDRRERELEAVRSE